MTAEIIALTPDDTPIPGISQKTPPTPQAVQKIIEPSYYDIAPILKIEEDLKYTKFHSPATKSPDIETIFGIIEQITRAKDIESIKQFLENTQEHTARARADIQRCGALLQKIAAIRDNTGTINWNLIFSRLKLDT